MKSRRNRSRSASPPRGSAAKGLFPFIALATVRDALSKKVLFEVIYRARLMTAAEAASLHLINEAVAQSEVLPRAVALAEEASVHDPEIVALGRGLYYGTRAARPSESMRAARQALLAALGRGPFTALSSSTVNVRPPKCSHSGISALRVISSCETPPQKAGSLSGG